MVTAEQDLGPPRAVGQVGMTTGSGGSDIGATTEGALWGARFASGPSPELARLSK